LLNEVNSKTGEVIQERQVFNKKIDFPKSIQELGFNHKEQIEILQESQEEFDKAKWCLWHGNSIKSLTKLKNLQVTIGEKKAKLSGLITYIKNNQQHIINYQKHDARMQWSRIGADCILQIRSSKQSNTWNTDWVSAQKLMCREAI